METKSPRQPNQPPQGTGKILAAEEDFFFSMRKSSKTLSFVSIASVLISIILFIASIWIVNVGKGKDKIIERDATGRPSILQVDSPDVIHTPELEVFVRESIREILTWTYMEVRGGEDHDRRMNKIAGKFTPAGFKQFYQPFRDIYLRSIAEQRLVVTAELAGLKDLKLNGADAFIQVNIKRSSIRVIGEGASEEQREVKLFEIRVHKGIRTLDNPYGLYISRFSELHTAK